MYFDKTDKHYETKKRSIWDKDNETEGVIIGVKL